MSLNGSQIIAFLALLVGFFSLYRSATAYKDKKLDDRFKDKVGITEFKALKDDVGEFKAEVDKDMCKIEEDLKSKVSKDVLDEVKKQFDDQKVFFQKIMDNERVFISQVLDAQNKRMDSLERQVRNK